MKQCPLCGGKGFIIDEEPQEFIDGNGNEQFRFVQIKLVCTMCKGKGTIEE